MYNKRSEEEKTQDILFYEKKSKARDLLGSFEKKRRRARIIAAVVFAVASAVAAKPVINAYDRELVPLLVALIVSVVAVTVISYYAAGAVSQRSLICFIKWQKLYSAWKIATEEMSKTEEKYLDGTAFDPDVEKAENNLLDLAERIISYGK